MGVDVTTVLSEGVRTALRTAGLPEPGTVSWEVPRETDHGDYATNLAMLMARAMKQSPRKVAEAIRDHLPPIEAVERVEGAGPGGRGGLWPEPARAGAAGPGGVRLGQSYRSPGHCERPGRGRGGRPGP